MYLPVELLSNKSRIWIYQSDRKLSTEEVASISNDLRSFCDDWNVHGQPLPASFDVRFEQFIILFADESQMQTSGCSIDSSVRQIREIAGKFQLDLFNRELIGFLNPPADVNLIAMKRLKESFQAGMLNSDSLTFNNLITTKDQLQHSWIVPVGETWVKRYMPATVKS